MKSFLSKYKILMILVLFALVIHTYDYVNQLIMTHEVEDVIEAFDSSEVSSVSASINTFGYAFDIEENLQGELLNLILGQDFDLVRKKSFSLKNEKMYHLSISGEPPIQSITLFGRQYITIELLSKDRKYTSYVLEVNWDQVSYDRISQIIKESR